MIHLIGKITEKIEKTWGKFGFGEKPALSYIQISLDGTRKKGRLAYAIFEKGSESPVLYAKAYRNPRDDVLLEKEFELAKRLQTDEWLAQFLSAPISLEEIEGQKILFEMAAQGVPVSRLIQNSGIQPERFRNFTEEIVLAVAEWCGEFYKRTGKGSQVLDEKFFKERMVPVIDEFARNLSLPENERSSYLEFFKSRFEEVKGLSLPILATHENLGPQNILLDPSQERLCIIDWKMAREGQPFPLRDFYNFLHYYLYCSFECGFMEAKSAADAFNESFVSKTGWYSSIAEKGIFAFYSAWGVDEKLDDVLFPLSLIHELNTQYELAYRFEKAELSFEKIVLDLYIANKTRHVRQEAKGDSKKLLSLTREILLRRNLPKKGSEEALMVCELAARTEELKLVKRDLDVILISKGYKFLKNLRELRRRLPG